MTTEQKRKLLAKQGLMGGDFNQPKRKNMTNKEFKQWVYSTDQDEYNIFTKIIVILLAVLITVSMFVFKSYDGMKYFSYGMKLSTIDYPLAGKILGWFIVIFIGVLIFMRTKRES